MSLSFEIAVEADAGAIAAMRNAAAEQLARKYGPGNWASLATERSVLLHNFMRPKFQRTLIARDGPNLVATLCLQTKKPWAIDVKYFTNVSKALYLISMAVHPDWQGKGVGRLILKEAENIARSWPSNAIRLDAWEFCRRRTRTVLCQVRLSRRGTRDLSHRANRLLRNAAVIFSLY